MKKILLATAILLATLGTSAADKNTVEIVYNGSTATVTVASNISSYITDESNGSSHVKLIQSASVDATVGEITYILSGSSTDGEFYLEGSYKATLSLAGLTLANPSGPALNIQDGKRIQISAKNNTENTLSDGSNDDYKGCIHCKGHTELKGKGTLNITGNSRHGIYSKEYVEVKNLTLNILKAKKDGIHCQEYFLMESGTVTISGTGDDAIQVELKDASNPTGTTEDHEDEDSGNFYQTGGTLSLSNYGGKAIKADGTVSVKSDIAASDIEQNVATGIADISIEGTETGQTIVYDLNGRQMAGSVAQQPKGVYIVREGRQARKVIVK